MKKLLIMAMIAILTLGFSVVVFADEDAKSDTAVVAKGDTKITIGGEIRFRGTYTHDVLDSVEDASPYYLTLTNNTGAISKAQVGTVGASDDHRSWYDTRVRLSVDAKVSDTVEGFIELESGTSNSSDTVMWGSSSGATGLYTAGNAKSNTLYIRQAWIQYAKNGYGVKVGHQPLILGNGLFFDHTKFGDDAIVAFVQPVKDLTIAALTAKFKEGSGATTGISQNNADDGDAYVLLASYKTPHFNLSGDITFVNDQSFYSTAGQNAHLWNFGLRADGTIGQLTLRGDLELQTGSLRILDSSRAEGYLDAHAQGWAFLAGVDYKLIAPVKLTLEFAYGSGDGTDYNANRTTSNSTTLKSFITTQGLDQHYTFVYDYMSYSACSKLANGDVSGTFSQNNGLCNTMYLKGGVTADLTKSLYGELNVYWLRAARAVSIYGNTGDTATYSSSTYTSTINYHTPSTELGWEIDAKLQYKLAKNLKYWVEGGYFFTGAAYDQIKNITYNTTSRTWTLDYQRADAYAIRHGIQLNF
ncbi:alginate export family protein [Candidatus Magnetomonas plexicatena]|uniref:alginate export family protein n=1 Tax=Candidatus Magnetomonas plexicatena TaxID=2552947 RepID=UPI001C773C10|nr:alginate export family protein [Nitrospirales bacterium LBB_01]